MSLPHFATYPELVTDRLRLRKPTLGDAGPLALIQAEVGYVLAISQWGRGVMKELMPALLRFGFEEMKLHRIEARVDPENTASIRVLTRAGFQQEGVLRDTIADGESFRSTVVFSLLEGEWRKAG